MYKRKNVKKSSISLLKGYRGSIAGDGPSPSNQTRIFTRRRNDGHQGIRIMRNRRVVNSLSLNLTQKFYYNR